jgi:HEAT repeat protein
MKEYRYTEGDLNTNLSELASELVRELDLACRKVSIYSSAHPLSDKAIGRLFISLERVFRYKKYFNLHTVSGKIYALNILLKPTVFSDHILDFMQKNNVRSVLLESSIDINELTCFLDGFANRRPQMGARNPLAAYIDDKELVSATVDSEIGYQLFDNGRLFADDLPGGYTVRNVLMNMIGFDPERLFKIMSDDSPEPDQYVLEYDLDYYPSLVQYIYPEIISTIDSKALVKFISEKISECNDDDKSLINYLARFIGYHPDLSSISEEVETLLDQGNMTGEFLNDLKPADLEVVESTGKIDQFLYTIFNNELPGYELGEFKDQFERLIRTGRNNHIRSVVNILYSQLAAPQFELREKALILFRQLFESCRDLSADKILEYVISKLDEYICEEKETFEFSDLIWEISKICMSAKYDTCMDNLCDTLAKKRSQSDGIFTYESVAVKKAIEDLNRPEIIDSLLDELVQGPSSRIPLIRKVMVTIGSDEAAYALSTIISHEQRNVRMQVLKILGDMGKAALRVCTEIMKNNAYFHRSGDRRELPDEKWYIVRNAIFVLGSLNDPEGCRALGYRISDDDTRVRRNIISALEQIGGEHAGDLLLTIADDADREIREAAIIALGIIRQGDLVPELIDLSERHPSEIMNVIVVLGKIKNPDAKSYLMNILKDNDLQSKYTTGRSSRDDIRLACLKALGKIGDEESLEAIRSFNNSMTSTQKIFFGGSKLTKAAEDILNRKS